MGFPEFLNRSPSYIRSLFPFIFPIHLHFFGTNQRRNKSEEKILKGRFFSQVFQKTTKTKQKSCSGFEIDFSLRKKNFFAPLLFPLFELKNLSLKAFCFS